jgi:Family of unknown function (DUF6459)
MVPDAAPPYDHNGRDGGPGPGGQPGQPGQAAAPRPAAAPAIPVTPEAKWARPLAQAIIEAVAGIRPFRQLVPVTTERVQAQLKRLIPVLRTDGEVRLRRVLASRTGADVVDVTVIAGFGPRTRALAMRFEQIPARPAAPGLPPRPARWLCTDVATP